MYDNQRDAAMRLDGTIVRLNGDVVRIEEVTSDTRFRYTYLRTGREGDADLLGSGLDLSPVPLGFINYKGEALYATRIPARKWKQGLANNGYTVRGRGLVGRIYLCPSLADCIEGVYPSLNTAIDMLDHGYISVAFCRTLAVCSFRNGVSLMWKDKRVARFTAGVVVLDKRYKFLEELIEGLMS